MGLPVPLTPVHLLFINLLTDSLPALAIGMEPADDDLLKEKPRNPREGILTRGFMITMITQGLLIAAASMTAYHIGLTVSSAIASTMAFATLTLARLFHGFNCRGSESIFRLGLTSNRYSLYAFRCGSFFTGTGNLHPGAAQCIQHSRSAYDSTWSDRGARSHADSDYTDNENYQA